MKHFFCALALSTMLAPALAQETTFFDSVPTTPPTITMKNAIVVTPIIVPDDDLRSMLDVQMWHFTVKAPAGGATPSARLELRVTGQTPKPLEFTDGGVLNRKNSDVVVGVAPVEGNDLSKAKQWKIYLRTKADPTDIFSAAGSNEIENPLKDLKFEITRTSAGAGYALPKTNGDIPLISLYTVAENFDHPPTLTAEIVLVLTAETPQPKN